MRREEDHALVDLHLHSRASGTATNWWVRGLGAEVEARESYTPPEVAYRMAKKAGMDFVTLPDPDRPAACNVIEPFHRSSATIVGQHAGLSLV